MLFAESAKIYLNVQTGRHQHGNGVDYGSGDVMGKKGVSFGTG